MRHKQVALTEAAERLLRVHGDWAEVDGPLARQLLGAHILIAEGSPEHEFEQSLGDWRELGSAALYYHLASRTLEGDVFRTAAQDAQVLRAKESQPPPGKAYDGERVGLPRSAPPDSAFADVVRARRSTRWFDEHVPIPLESFASLLQWTAGATAVVDVASVGEALLKPVPSGGARHPIEVYPVIRDVDGVEPGLYHYHVLDHALERLGGKVDEEELLRWCGGQPHAAKAGCLLLYTAVLERTVWKYPSARAYRALLLDAGHLSHAVYLTATALGLGVFFTAATRDANVENALGLAWTDEILLGLSGIGVPHPVERRRQEAMLAGGPPAFSFPPDEWHGTAE